MQSVVVASVSIFVWPSGVAVLDAFRCQVKVCLIIYVKLLLL